MEYKNLEHVLDSLFGPFGVERALIISAIQRDLSIFNKVSTSDNASKILLLFNEVFDKKSRIISKKVLSKYKEILKHYDIEDIKTAMNNAKNDDFHKENNYKYCTIEYFSRIEQMDKWSNIKKQPTKSDFVLPTFNIRA